MKPSRRLSPKVISIIVIALIAIGSTAVYAVKQSADSTGGQTATTTTQQSTASDDATTDTTTTESATSSNSSYKDGTYTETGKYSTPGGTESVTVTVTLASGTISDVSATGSSTGGESSEYQSEFLSSYKQYVAGKSIDSVSLSRVAGSSLTSNGFNRALDQIKSDAAA